MNLVHVVPHVDEEAAGPSYAVPRLCQELGKLGNEVQLTCLAAREEIPYVVLDLHAEWPILKRFAISTSLASALYRKASEGTVVHNHSLWSMVNVATGWVVPGRGAKLVTSPHGTLSAWALNRNKHLKQLLWPLQRRALARADLLHATSEAEYDQIRSAGFSTPVAVIPNGVDLPDMLATDTDDGSPFRTLLFLSRIHPTKGLDRLLQGWAEMEHRFPNWQLVIAGRGEDSYVSEIHRLSRQLGLTRVFFPGPLYGGDKANAYRNADLFVLPTHSENFGMVVAEALSHGCPAIVGRGAPWAGLETENCGWWVDITIDALVDSLSVAMSLSSHELQTMGLRGRTWMERDFGWNSIALKMIGAYQWLFEGGDPPAWVRLD